MNFYKRVKKSCRADKLLDNPRASLLFFLPRCCRNVNDLVQHRLELCKFQWAVVERGRQAEPKVYKVLLSAPVAFVHCADLGQRYVRLVYKTKKIVRKIVEQRCGRLAVLAAGNRTGIVFYAGAVTHLLKHLYVVGGACFKALSFKNLACLTEVFYTFFHFRLYAVGGCFYHAFRQDKMLCRINHRFIKFFAYFARNSVEAANP